MASIASRFFGIVIGKHALWLCEMSNRRSTIDNRRSLNWLNRPRQFIVAAVSFVSCLSVLSPQAQAEVSRGKSQKVDSTQVNQAGPGAKSSNLRQTLSVGASFSNDQLKSAHFQLRPGLLWSTLSSTDLLPPTELDLSVLYAKVSPAGVDILPKTWQIDKDPIFLWEPPATGLELAGYSYAIGESPDDEVDTTRLSFDVAQSSLVALPDGQHVFTVKAINTAGQSGNPLSFDLWIDTTPPQILSYTPPSGVLLNTRSTTISASLTDQGCGVDVSHLALLVNRSNAAVQFDPATGILVSTSSEFWKEGTNSLELRVADFLGNAQTPLVWSLSMDTTPPEGSVRINADAQKTTTIYVTLDLNASDALSGIDRMMISHEELSGYVEEPFVTTRSWLLRAVRGSQKVYVKFIDKAGNVSEPYFDEIELQLFSPDTRITSGPAGVVTSPVSSFTFQCSEADCVFSYAFDHDAWSAWSKTDSVTRTDLGMGNHYFRVKAAKESNGINGIQADEEDPSPAERTWIVEIEQPLTIPLGPPIKLWRLE